MGLVCDDSPMRGPKSHLMWIGRTDSRYFRDAFAWAVNQCDAVTVRGDVNQAIERANFPATHLAVVRDDSREIPSEAWDRICEKFDSAVRMEFRSPIAEAFYRHADRRINGGQHRWCDMVDRLSRRMKLPSGSAVERTVAPEGLTVVVAKRFDMAEAILAALDSRVSAVYCCGHDEMMGGRFHGVSRVIWDDSVVPPDRIGDWAGIVKGIESDVRHFWATTDPSPSLVTEAIERGVTSVLWKPAMRVFEPSAMEPSAMEPVG